MSSQAKQGGPSRSLARRAFRFGEHVFAALGLAFVIYHLLFDLSVMASPSMSPTLQGTGAENGDWVLTERLSLLLRGPRRWEVIAFRNNEGQQVMKRVVGLPGETVSLAGSSLLVGGEPLARPKSLDCIEYIAYGKLHKGKEAECGDGYFVLGDDSVDSQDSRFEGPVEPGRVRGRAWLVVWPPARIGFVNP